MGKYSNNNNNNIIINYAQHFKNYNLIYTTKVYFMLFKTFFFYIFLQKYKGCHKYLLLL